MGCMGGMHPQSLWMLLILGRGNERSLPTHLHHHPPIPSTHPTGRWRCLARACRLAWWIVIPC